MARTNSTGKWFIFCYFVMVQSELSILFVKMKSMKAMLVWFNYSVYCALQNSLCRNFYCDPNLVKNGNGYFKQVECDVESLIYLVNAKSVW